MPAFSSRGDDGIERTVELELQACDICHKVVLADAAPATPQPFTERQWPAIQAQLEKLTGSVEEGRAEGARRYPQGVFEVQPYRLEELWGR